MAMVFFVTGGSRHWRRHRARRGCRRATTWPSPIAVGPMRPARSKSKPRRWPRPQGQRLSARRQRAQLMSSASAMPSSMTSTRCMSVPNAGININNLVVSMSDEGVARGHPDQPHRRVLRRPPVPVDHALVNGFGRIIFISSLGASGVSGQANHSASKAGLIGLSSAMARNTVAAASPATSSRRAFRHRHDPRHVGIEPRLLDEALPAGPHRGPTRWAASSPSSHPTRPASSTVRSSASTAASTGPLTSPLSLGSQGVAVPGTALKRSAYIPRASPST